VAIVYSTLEALKLARERPDRQVVFLAVGFETTAPATSAALVEARSDDVANFTIYCAHKLMIPAMEALLEAPDLAIDGFLAPGHVSVVIGADAYRPLAEKYSRPFAVAGFEPDEILGALAEIMEYLAERKGGVINAYPKAVAAEGNPRARELLFKVFEPADAVWRGLGTIPASGLALRPEWQEFDACSRFALPEPTDSGDLAGCRCGEVIRGAIAPEACPQFAEACTPRTPKGPCMVSREGSCQTHYRYKA
jgi:hydrogenase expression/formation protein HypD